jgi:hypothetical protein
MEGSSTVVQRCTALGNQQYNCTWYLTWTRNGAFFEKGAKALPFRLNKREFTSKKRITRTPHAYSPGIMVPNFFAPASTHKRVSALILSTIAKEGESLLWKIRTFLSLL